MLYPFAVVPFDVLLRRFVDESKTHPPPWVGGEYRLMSLGGKYEKWEEKKEENTNKRGEKTNIKIHGSNKCKREKIKQKRVKRIKFCHITGREKISSSGGRG
jgi:hypothetical protein